MTLWTAKEVAKFLKLHPYTLREMVNSGQLDIPHRRLGSGPKARYLFSKEAVEAWVSKPQQQVDVRTGRLHAIG